MKKISTRVWMVLAAGGLTTALAVTALAKPPGPPPGHGPGDEHHKRGHGPRGGPGQLLRVPEVRDELGVTDEQGQELRELHREFGKQMRSEMRDLMRQAREGGEEEREAVREAMKSLHEKGQAKLAEVLGTEQIERLKQIHTQQVVKHRGMRGLLRGPIGEQLDLTDDQKEMLREKGRELHKQMREKMKAAQEEARQQLLEILTSEQRQQLEGMMGEPFDLPPPPEMGRRHGRRHGGPGGPPEGRRRGGDKPEPPGPPPGDEL